MKPQRPLWASTGVKDPAYDDTMYAVELVAPGTVNTMPEATVQGVHEHGTLRGDTVCGSYDAAERMLEDLRMAGIDYDDVVQVLEDQRLATFEHAWGDLIESVTDQLEKAGAARPAGRGPAAASREASGQ